MHTYIKIILSYICLKYRIKVFNNGSNWTKKRDCFQVKRGKGDHFESVGKQTPVSQHTLW